MTATVAPQPGKRRTSRSPGIVYSALSGAILVLVAALAVTSSRNGPPAIAAYAPQAAQQIKQAPLEQTSTVGGALGGEGELTTTTTSTTTTAPAAKGGAAGVTTTTEPVVERARVRRCVGNPPRQTEDPQSPPCVAFWQGDNGGTTYPNVFRDKLVLAAPGASKRVMDDLAAYFNSRYEFYGRKVEFVQATAYDRSTCAERKAGADADVDQTKIFASLTSNDGNAGFCYATQLARRGHIAVAADDVEYSEADMASFRPYLWQYSASFDKQLAGIGQMLCGRLAGKTASHSADPALVALKRSYGVILQNIIRDSDLSLQPLFDALAKCGEKVDPKHVYRLSTNDDTGLTHPEQANSAIVQLKADNVTTVLNLGIVFLEQNIANAADSQSYYPEWIFNTYGANDINNGIAAFWPGPRNRRSIMGVSATPPMRPFALDPGYVAMREVDPGTNPAKDSSEITNFIHYYRSMLVMASGIQMAGPNLTPANFERALQSTTFPNPTDDATKSGKVGFKGDHSMTDDYSEYWWNDTAVGPLGYQSTTPPGAICYVDQAKRVSLGSWPTGDPFLQPTCYPGPQ